MIELSQVAEFLGSLFRKSKDANGGEQEKNTHSNQRTMSAEREKVSMDAVAQVVCAIIARAEGIQSAGQTIGVVLRRPSASRSGTAETERLLLSALARSVANSLAGSRLQ